MDEITIKQNVFLQVKDRSMDSDLTVVPVELNFHFAAKLRRGMMLRYGWTQEIKTAFRNVTLRVRECQHVQKQFNIHNYGQGVEREARDFRLSELQKLLCSTIEDGPPLMFALRGI